MPTYEAAAELGNAFVAYSKAFGDLNAEEMDRAVLRAYGWEHIEVPPYVTPETDAERRALETFEDEVIDQLFVLNAERAREEKLQGLVAGRGKGGKKKVRRAKKESDADQMTLGLG